MSSVASFSAEQVKSRTALIDRLSKPLNFRLYTLTQVPLGFIAGMRIDALSEEECRASLPARWVNKNPFRSLYFAAQSMAAELSTAALAMLAIQGYRPSVAFIITNLRATFVKKATAKVTFTCTDGAKVLEAVQKAIQTGEAVAVEMETIGREPDGTEVSRFYFTWSFKQRSK